MVTSKKKNSFGNYYVSFGTDIRFKNVIMVPNSQTVRAKPELNLIISDNVKTYFQQRGIDYDL